MERHQNVKDKKQSLFFASSSQKIKE